ARGRRVRVPRSDDNLCNAGVDHRLRARRSRAPARARLERDVERRRAGAVAGGGERVRLGVRLALPLVPALADDLVITDENSADDGVRLRRPAPAFSELEGPLEIVHCDAATRPR